MTPEQIADRESKFALKLVDSSAKQFTVGTPIDIGDGFDIKPLTTKFDSFFYHSETKKTKICLHFTVGVLPGDIATLTKENNHMSVQYVVDGLGNTYSLFDDAYWSYHLGAKAVGGNADMSKQSIGIEISNYGPLTSKEGKFLDAYGNVFTSDVDFVDEINYRGYYFYAKMTDRQIDAVAHLLVYLCQKHMIPIEFKEDGEPFASNKEALSFTGIFCHSNVRKDKFDMPPEMVQKIVDRVEELIRPEIPAEEPEPEPKSEPEQVQETKPQIEEPVPTPVTEEPKKMSFWQRLLELLRAAFE